MSCLSLFEGTKGVAIHIDMVLVQIHMMPKTATLKHALTDFDCHFLTRIAIDNECPLEIF